MPRRCTTTPGYGTCCRAAQAGLLNRVMKMDVGTSGRQRCAICTTHASTSTDPRKRGRTVFQFRWVKNSDPQCGIGPSGCPYLGNQGNPQLTLQP
jgi:hypothetical protein